MSFKIQVFKKIRQMDQDRPWEKFLLTVLFSNFNMTQIHMGPFAWLVTIIFLVCWDHKNWSRQICWYNFVILALMLYWTTKAVERRIPMSKHDSYRYMFNNSLKMHIFSNLIFRFKLACRYIWKKKMKKKAINKCTDDKMIMKHLFLLILYWKISWQ